jgi:peptidoglycan/xylan/chitin deacetylase (PgdA/CDA1 family)
MRKLLSYLYLAALLLPFPGAARAAGISQDMAAAVILVYHRVGEDQFPDSNIGADQFAAELDELKTGGYNVMKLPDIVAAIREERTLPPRTVAITFDGGMRSVLEKAAPLLIQNNLPFTLFIAPGQASGASPQYMHWDELRRLARSPLVSFGLHPALYTRLQDKELLAQINSARAQFREQMRIEPALFSYPFGEYDLAFRNLIEKQGFAAAFGEQSGVLHPGSDIFAIPRFTVTEAYGGPDRFRMIATALPLPVTDISPADPQLSTAMPAIGFTLDKALVPAAASLSCFAADAGKPDMQFLPGGRVELRLARPFEDDRARVNCTMPAYKGVDNEDQRWRWFGMLMTVQKEEEPAQETSSYASPLGD